MEFFNGLIDSAELDFGFPTVTTEVVDGLYEADDDWSMEELDELAETAAEVEIDFAEAAESFAAGEEVEELEEIGAVFAGFSPAT